MRSFHYKTLAIAIASIGAISTAHAAGLDRSGQDVSAFLQDGTYAEAVYTYIDADIKGKDIHGNETGDIAESYDFFRYGVKTDVGDRFSIGVLYDEPFGAAVQYEDPSDFVSQDSSSTISILTDGKYTTAERARIAGLGRLGGWFQRLQSLQTQIAEGVAAGQDVSSLQRQAANVAEDIMWLSETNSIEEAQAYFNKLRTDYATALVNGQQEVGSSTNVEIRTNNVTMLMGVKLGENKNFQIYGGPVAQRLTGEVHLRGLAYSAATGYDATISPDQAYGWAAGIAYSKPEIALKAALTYRSKIDHDTTIAEVFPARAINGYNATDTRDFSVSTPESWNLDFQTGLSAKHRLLGTAKIRYVPWSDFDVRPPLYGESTAASYGTALPIVSYDKDQWQVELGLGKQINDKLSVAGNIGWDSGAGSPATTLGPIKGYYSVGGGVKYNFTPEWSLSVGGKYLKFGDADAVLPTYALVGDSAKVARFEDNDGFVAGVKLAYQAK